MLPPEGTFFTCNVCPNPERRFLKHVINWDMIYRSGHQLKDLMQAGGFAPEKVRIVHEPLGIHALAICTNQHVSTEVRSSQPAAHGPETTAWAG